MKKNILVTLADENYIDQAKQLFSSVYWNAGWQGDYLLLANEIPEKDLKWFRKKGILIKKVKGIDNCTEKNVRKYPSSVLSKFYLFTPCFKEWKNVIFLDADIIVRAPLESLTKVKRFSGANVIGWRLENYFISHKNKKEYKQLKKEYDLKKLTFNSGVMAFNTTLIKENTFEKIMELFEKYKNICNGDDDLLNLFFYNQWQKQPPVYNLPVNEIRSCCGVKPEKIRGIVLHFIHTKGKEKPWHPKNYFYKEWKFNLTRSDQIDLKKNPNSKRKWSKKRILLLSGKINFRLKMNKNFGLAGKILNSKWPKAYELLKKYIK